MKNFAPVLLLLCGNAHAEMFSCINADGIKILRNISCEQNEKSKLIASKNEQPYSVIDSTGQMVYYRSGGETVYVDNINKSTRLNGASLKYGAENNIVSIPVATSTNILAMAAPRELQPTIIVPKTIETSPTDTEIPIEAVPLQDQIESSSTNLDIQIEAVPLQEQMKQDISGAKL